MNYQNYTFFLYSIIQLVIWFRENFDLKQELETLTIQNGQAFIQISEAAQAPNPEKVREIMNLL